MSERLLVTGGAGFVGSTLALSLKRYRADARVIAFDNLHRAGSELNLSRLEAGGVEFVRGDVRRPDDIDAVGAVDWLYECSAEPSVHAGYGDDPRYLLDTNLLGAINCLEHLRKHGGDLAFVSTSRVYPIEPLRSLPLATTSERYQIAAGKSGDGWSRHGISESFSLDGTRSLYGTTKLSAELLVAEYAAMYGVRAIVDRCGVLAGPWQMGKVDQGFVSLWAARHVFGGPLNYVGFGGNGHQVRDILHPEDLCELLAIQTADPDRFSGRVFNVGGGPDVSVSLRELTALCRELSGVDLEPGREPETRDADIPYYVSDIRRIADETGWKPRRSAADIVEETLKWLTEERTGLEHVFQV